MIDLLNDEADFEAEITILTQEQGGRINPPQNFIRWDFGYPEDGPEDPIYMIHPNFLDEDGVSIPKGLPLVGTYHAKMFIIVRPMVRYHRTRILVGTQFNCHEGSRVVAHGRVTKLLKIGD